MRASLLGLGVVVLLEACSASGPPRSEISEADLLSGSVLGPSIADATVPAISMDDALALDDDMRAFLRGISDTSQPAVKVNRLLDAMKQRGLLSLDYNDAITHTVSATFHERQGNCLSFTMLFVALAREVGLRASFQLVDVPPTWTRDLDLVVVGSHVNSIVQSRFDRDVVVDFNAANSRDDYRTRKIDDKYAAALYYSNVGAEALLHRDYAASLAFLREAVRVHADMAAPWVNIGVLYGRQGRYDYAEAAYFRALEADPRLHTRV